MKTKTLLLLTLPLLLLAMLAAAYLFLRSPSAPSSASGALQTKAASAAPAAAAPLQSSSEASASAAESSAGVASQAREVVDSSAASAGEDAWWIEGVVRIPPATPEDPTLGVQASSSYNNNERTSVRVPVDSAGRFRIAVPKERETMYLTVDGRYLYSKEAQGTAVTRAEAEALELDAELGAWVHGQVLLPSGVLEGEALASALDKAKVELRAKVSVFDPGDWQRRRGLRREGELDERGAFEFRGAVPEVELVAEVDCEGYAPYSENQAPLKAGEERRLDPQLGRGARLAGVVVDASGAPVPQAEVVVADVRSAFGGGDGGLSRDTKTDEAGRFNLLGAPVGKVRIMPKADGYLQSMGKSYELREGEVREDLELALDSGGSLSGRVLWDDGTPAVDVKVSAMIDPAAMQGPGAMSAWRGMRGEDQTDEQGNFAISGLGKSRFDLRAEGKRSGDSTLLAVLKGVQGGSSDLLLTLEPRISISGRVIDAAGVGLQAFELKAEPAGTAAWMRGMSGRDEVGQRYTEALEGAFVLSGLEPGEWELRATAESFGPSAALRLTLPLAAGAAPILIRMEPAAGISGLVLRPDGSPAPGARVVRASDGGGFGNWGMGSSSDLSATSDAQGHFALDSIGAGSISLVAKLDGFAQSEASVFELAAGAREDQAVLRLRLGGRISGVVYGKDGAPSSGRMVNAQLAAMGEMKNTSTDAAGHFELEHLTPGDWQVVAIGALEDMLASSENQEESEGMNMSWMNELKMTMAKVEDGATVEVELGAAPANPVHVSGRVSAGDSGVAGMLSFFPQDGEAGQSGLGALKLTTSDAQGSYSLDLERPGRYLVTLQQMGGGMAQQTSIEFYETIPELPETRLDLALPVGTVRGRVYGPEGAPLPGARITLSTEGGARAGSFTGGNYSENSCDEQGYYELRFLRPGSYTLAAGGSQMGGMLGESTAPSRLLKSGISLAEGEVREGVDFHLTRGGALQGRVLSADGSPAAGAALFVRDDQGRLLERFSLVMSDGEGRFRVTGLGEGSYTLSARRGEFASVESRECRVSLTGEAAPQIELRLAQGTRLIVTVLGADDQPMAALVSVTDSAGRPVHGMLAMTDLAELFQEGVSGDEQRFGPLPPGAYKVVALALDGRTAAKPVTLSGQSERRLKLHFE